MMNLLLFFVAPKKQEAAPLAGEFPHVTAALTTSNANRHTANVSTLNTNNNPNNNSTLSHFSHTHTPALSCWF